MKKFLKIFLGVCLIFNITNAVYAVEYNTMNQASDVQERLRNIIEQKVLKTVTEPDNDDNYYDLINTGEDYLSRYNDDTDVMLYVADANISVGAISAAQKLYEEVLNYESRNLNAINSLIMIYDGERDCRKANNMIAYAERNGIIEPENLLMCKKLEVQPKPALPQQQKKEKDDSGTECKIMFLIIITLFFGFGYFWDNKTK